MAKQPWKVRDGRDSGSCPAQAGSLRLREGQRPAPHHSVSAGNRSGLLATVCRPRRRGRIAGEGEKERTPKGRECCGGQPLGWVRRYWGALLGPSKASQSLPGA